MRFCFIFPFLFFANTLLSQSDLSTEKDIAKIEKQDFSKKNNSPLPSLHSVFSTNVNLEKPTSYFSIKKSKSSKMPFFCDVEAKVEKASKLPVRFRLGDAQTVDRKEGKWQQFRPLPHISN